MYNMRLSNGVELSVVGALRSEVIIETIFIFASIINMEVAKTDNSFLKTLDKYLNNSPFYYNSNT